MDLKTLKNLDFLKSKKFKKQQSYTIFMVWRIFVISFLIFFIIGVLTSILIFSYTASVIEDTATYNQTFDTTRVENISKKLDSIENAIKIRSGVNLNTASQN